MGRPGESKNAVNRLLTVIAVVVGITIQLLVLGWTFLSGLMWTGWGHRIALGQAVVALVVVLWLGRRWVVVAIVVPVLSVLLTYGLWTAAMREGHNPRACTAAEEAILRELTPPGATLTDIRGDNDRCFATVASTRSPDEVRAQYEHELADHGWEKEPTDYPYATSAVRDGLRVLVEAPPVEGENLYIQVSPE